MTLTIWLAPLTIGLSQENQAEQVCLPEDQVKALLEDAKLKEVFYDKTLLLSKDINILQNQLILCDSTEVMLNEKLEIKNEQIKNLEAQQDQWWIKWGYLLIGTLVGVGVNEITN